MAWSFWQELLRGKRFYEPQRRTLFQRAPAKPSFSEYMDDSCTVPTMADTINFAKTFTYAKILGQGLNWNKFGFDAVPVFPPPEGVETSEKPVFKGQPTTNPITYKEIRGLKKGYSTTGFYISDKEALISISEYIKGLSTQNKQGEPVAIMNPFAVRMHLDRFLASLVPGGILLEIHFEVFPDLPPSAGPLSPIQLFNMEGKHHLHMRYEGGHYRLFSPDVSSADAADASPDVSSASAAADAIPDLSSAAASPDVSSAATSLVAPLVALSALLSAVQSTPANPDLSSAPTSLVAPLVSLSALLSATSPEPTTPEPTTPEPTPPEPTTPEPTPPGPTTPEPTPPGPTSLIAPISALSALISAATPVATPGPTSLAATPVATPGPTSLVAPISALSGLFSGADSARIPTDKAYIASLVASLASLSSILPSIPLSPLSSLTPLSPLSSEAAPKYVAIPDIATLVSVLVALSSIFPSIPTLIKKKVSNNWYRPKPPKPPQPPPLPIIEPPQPPRPIIEPPKPSQPIIEPPQPPRPIIEPPKPSQPSQPEFKSDCTDEYVGTNTSPAAKTLRSIIAASAKYAAEDTVWKRGDTDYSLRFYNQLLTDIETTDDPEKKRALQLQLQKYYKGKSLDVRYNDGIIREIPILNPYVAADYRHHVVSFANPEPDPVNESMRQQNVKVLKSLVPECIMKDTPMAIAVLESLYFCGQNPDLINSPRCLPSRMVAQIREWQAAKEQNDVAGLAKQLVEEGRWAKVSPWVVAIKNALHNKPAVRRPFLPVPAPAVETSAPAVGTPAPAPAPPPAKPGRKTFVVRQLPMRSIRSASAAIEAPLVPIRAIVPAPRN